MGKFSVSTPASSAGIMRFTDVKSGGIPIEPQHVLIAAVLFIVAIAVLHALIG